MLPITSVKRPYSDEGSSGPSRIKMEKLLGEIPLTGKLPRSSNFTYDLDAFFHKMLPSLERLPLGMERMADFINFLILTKVEEREAPLGVRAQCWMKNNEGNHLFLSVFRDDYHSTIYPDGTHGAGRHLYISLSEWIDNGSTDSLTDDLLTIRCDIDDGFAGEWMTVNKSPSFSGTQAVKFAEILSRLLLTEATMWDASKIQVKNESLALSSWRSIAKATPENFYSRQGFSVIRVTNFQGKDHHFNQDPAVWASAVGYLREFPTEKLGEFLCRSDAACFKRVEARYPREPRTLTTLCQAIEQAVKGRNSPVAEGDRLFVNRLLYNALPLKSSEGSRLFSLAIRINAKSLILKSSAPFQPVELPLSLPFVDLVRSYDETNPEFPDSEEKLISWIASNL